MSILPAWPQVLDFFGTPLVIGPSPGQLSSDAGLLPVRQFDQRIGLTRAFAEALDDPRVPGNDLAMDRLSDHCFVANYFRLYLQAAAMNLLVRLRRFIAEPLPALALQAETASPTSQPGEAALVVDGARVPAEALPGAERQRHSRLRRQRDPLVRGTRAPGGPC
jgi:hypothetical protein